jgi:hypothetical protein
MFWFWMKCNLVLDEAGSFASISWHKAWYNLYGKGMGNGFQ